VAAAAPSVLAKVQPGLWEITREGAAPVRMCLADPRVLAHFEQRKAACSATLIRDDGTESTVHYTCGADFGQSRVTLLTPRSLRVQTQGISANAPFKYDFDARRVGDCPAH